MRLLLGFRNSPHTHGYNLISNLIYIYIYIYVKVGCTRNHIPNWIRLGLVAIQATRAHFNTREPSSTIPTLWHLIWKVQVPSKICNLVWRLLHDSLPTFHTLRSRGIPMSSLCPLCDEEEETTSHLFLFCPFARATWHGTSLAVHTSDFRNNSIQQWIRRLLQIQKKTWTR